MSMSMAANARHASTLILIKLELLVIYVEDLKLLVIITIIIIGGCVWVSAYFI